MKARGTFWQVSISGNLWGFLCHDGKGNGSSYVSVLRCLLWALYVHDVLLYCQTNNHNKRAITSWVCSIWIFKQSLMNRDKCHELCNKLRAYKTFCYNAKCFVYHEHCFKDNECICILFSGWLKAQGCLSLRLFVCRHDLISPERWGHEEVIIVFRPTALVILASSIHTLTSESHSSITKQNLHICLRLYMQNKNKGF